MSRTLATTRARSSHPAEAEAEDFHRALRDLIRLHQMRDRDRVCCYDVTVSGAHALEVLARLGAIPLNRLAAELFVDKSTASRIVGGLEERGYVARVPDPGDRRALRLELTGSGVETERRLRDDNVECTAGLLAGFPPEVRKGMLAFLRQFVRTSATQAGATNASCCEPDPEPGS